MDDRQTFFLRLLMDPARASDSLARICRDAGLKPADLLDLYRKASFAIAQTVATSIAADAIPAITADLAQKAVDHDVPCPTCRGAKTVNTGPIDKPELVRCATCNGNGTLPRGSDLDRQKTLLDMLGLGHKSGPSIAITNQNAQIAGGAVGALFSTFVKSTDKAAYDIDPTVIDGEVVK